MIALDPADAARRAESAQPARPATGMLLDTDDARIVVFNLAPAQNVPMHRSDSTVLLSVISGTGMISGGDEERRCRPGDLIAFAPGEPHGMRALDEPFHLMAVITPRPGTRNARATAGAAHSSGDAA